MAFKKKSPVWAYFEDDVNDPESAVCKLCEIKISRGGIGRKATTSGMLNHLKNKHNKEYYKLVPTFPKGQETTNQDTNVSNKPSTSKKQLTLEKCAEINKLWDINDPKAKKYHVLIAEMIALDNEAVNIVERAGFRRLINSALPRYNIPSRPYFSDNVIPEIYRKVVEKIKSLLSETDYISVTTDMWTCLHNHNSFLSFTAHFIDRQFNFKHVVLSIKHFEGQHTAMNIAMSLQEIANLWDIRKKIHIVIHDNGRNIVKAVSDAELASARCFIHTIQLIVNDCVKVQLDVTQMITTGRKIVTHFNHSGTAQEKLHSIQNDLGLPQHELVQDVSTRWNSTYYMLERLMQQKRAISVYLTDCHIANLTAAQWELLEHLLKLLQPFEEITKLTSSGYACISEIIPYVATLMRYYNKMSTSKELTPKLSQAILVIQQGLQERFEDITTSKNHLVATFLDPRFKMNVFTNQLQKEKVKQYVLIDSIKMSCEETSDDSPSSSPTLAKRMRTEEKSLNQTIHSTFMDCFEELIAEKSTASGNTSTEKNAVSTEMDLFLNISNISRHDNPYTWWQARKFEFPCLIKIAAKYLSAPGSSVYSERLFSEAGMVYEKKRSKLLPKNAEKLVFLHHNLPLLNFDYENNSNALKDS